MEKQVKKAIVEYLSELGCYYHMHVPVGYGSTTLDFLGCYQGFFFGIEAKRQKGGILSKVQLRIMDRIKKSGGAAWVESSENLHETQLQIQLLDEKFYSMHRPTP